MRERNRLAGAVEGLQKLEGDAADTLDLIDMADAEGDQAMLADGMATLHTLLEAAQQRAGDQPASSRRPCR